MPQKRPHKLEIHGDVRVDEYFWLKHRQDPEVIAYLEKENAHTELALAPLAGLRQKLFDEMRARIREDDSSAPYQDGDYWYYYRYVRKREYPLYCRRHVAPDAEEEVLLNVNELAEGEDYFAVRNFAVSPDHRLAAYAVDRSGRRIYTIYFLDLEHGTLLPDNINNTTSNFEWAEDSATILYTRQARGTLRWHQVLRHTLGDATDELVYDETDETCWLWVEKSLSSKFMFLVSAATVATEVRYLPADKPATPPALFVPRHGEHEYYVTDGMDRFYILTNDGATNFRVMQTPLDNTARDAWRELVAHREDVLIEGFDVFRDFIVLATLERGSVQLEVLDRHGGPTWRLDFDEDVYTAGSDDNYSYDTDWFRYTYESMTTPESTFDINLRTRERRLVKEDEILGSFDRDDYESRQLLIPARDGVEVPVSIVYRRDIAIDATRPLLLYGYGSYGATIDPAFDADLLSLLDRGFIYGVAHVRGGSKLGREWYYDGRQLKKMNTFNDFIDVSRYLVEQQYTSPRHLYALGGSAGGLLMGGVINMAPGLYNGIAAHVPFVDIVTTMLDDSIPLTTGEWDEWGDPNQEVFYKYMLSYSPYDNVRQQDYPNLLVTTGLHDSQVQYWEPAKWVARLRDRKTDDNLLLLKTDMAAGHTGKTGRFQSLEETVLDYAFFLHLEGVTE